MDLSRRALLGLAGLGVVGTAVSSRRLIGADIPGRGDDVLTIAILGNAQDAAARADLVREFTALHPEIGVRIMAIQGQDWSDFFAKILTLVAAGTPPDVVVVATEGAQLFADRLAYPLDEFVTRDADVLAGYFDDVHPSLIEAFMYEGNLYQLPIDFNAANLYYSTSALESAGLDRPDDAWTHEEFFSYAQAMGAARSGSFLPFFWTNRLWGGVVPWLYINDTSFLTETKAPGGDWLWERFYPGEQRSGGFRWHDANAEDEAVAESFDFLRAIVAEGLGSSPAQGGGGELVSRFAQGQIGMTPAGGFWVEGLAQGGMTPADYDVTYFPRWRSQRHQFGAAGYAIMRTSERKDEAWEWIKFCTTAEGLSMAVPSPNTTPVRRSLCNADFYDGIGPAHWNVFYDTLDSHESVPIPAPPQQAAVETALIKNVVGAVTASSDAGTRSHLATLQRDLELALRR